VPPASDTGWPSSRASRTNETGGNLHAGPDIAEDVDREPCATRDASPSTRRSSSTRVKAASTEGRADRRRRQLFCSALYRRAEERPNLQAGRRLRRDGRREPILSTRHRGQDPNERPKACPAHTVPFRSARCWPDAFVRRGARACRLGRCLLQSLGRRPSTITGGNSIVALAGAGEDPRKWTRCPKV
jgi:hypothetical protein